MPMRVSVHYLTVEFTFLNTNTKSEGDKCPPQCPHFLFEGIYIYLEGNNCMTILSINLSQYRENTGVECERIMIRETKNGHADQETYQNLKKCKEI